MVMFEELNNRRKAVEQNIVKSFVEENDIEKAREKKTFSIGDTFTRHGITYRCTGISPNTGRPTWSKVSGGIEKPKEEEKQQKETKQTGKLSDLQVGDEVEIVEDNKGKITKKKGKITKVNAASFEVGRERFYKRTGYHVGMDNVKIQIPK
jgi:hypothetical protein